jgi:hypothetical protein
MRRSSFIFVLLIFNAIYVCAQAVSWEIKAAMPEAVSNNAVAAATRGGISHVYSFAGIDTSKDWFGLHLRSFRYNTATDSWDTIPPLPDPNGGKIAAGASTVKNKIYIIGGYHVASNYSETSSSKVHIYDPEANVYLPDGADILFPIDDQVQAVWRDSLIFVVTGWSNSTNVAHVQIYNPADDSWALGTPVPNNTQWKVFGASGTIIGDTLYYAGGARTGFNFPPSTTLRKGYINPDDPTDISWEDVSTPVSRGYRMAADVYDNQPIWIGGSNVTYNFDGIAYNGSGGVPALGRIKLYDPTDGSLIEHPDLFPPTMDLRGIAKISDNQYLLAGGMLAGQQVTEQTLMITIDQLSQTTTEATSGNDLPLYPNPSSGMVNVDAIPADFFRTYDLTGRLVLEGKVTSQSFDCSSLENGLYFVQLFYLNQPLSLYPLTIQK